MGVGDDVVVGVTSADCDGELVRVIVLVGEAVRVLVLVGVRDLDCVGVLVDVGVTNGLNKP